MNKNPQKGCFKMKVVMIFFNVLLLSFSVYAVELPKQNHSYNHSSHHWTINTSNTTKLDEYKELLGKEGISLHAIKIDQDEIDADPLSVVAHKASQIGERILVDDTSLDIEGEDVGVNLRWLIDDIPKYVGKKALWRVLLAYRSGDQVFIYRGEVPGTIVPPAVKGDPRLEAIFLPDGASVTLGVDKPDLLNPRALAVDSFIRNELEAILPTIDSWDGPWQAHE